MEKIRFRNKYSYTKLLLVMFGYPRLELAHFLGLADNDVLSEVEDLRIVGAEKGGDGAVIHSGLSGQDGKQKRRNERKDSQRGGTHNFFSQIGREPRNAVAGPHNEGPSGAYRQPYMRCNYFLSGPPVRTSAPHLAPHKIAVTDYGVPRNRGQGFDKGKSLRWERDGFR